MSTLLIRSLRRLASVEDTVTDFALTNFRKATCDSLDLTLSVYALDDDEHQVTRARTEHRASFADPPEPQEASLSLHGFPDVDVTETPGDTRFFQFTREQHREMNFFNDEELVAMAEVVRAELVARQRVTTEEAMWVFVRGRLDGNDAEWESLCRKKKKWRKWSNAHPNQPQLPGIVNVSARDSSQHEPTT